MNHLDAVRQQLVDAVAHQRVRLAAADFHQHPGTRGFPLDLGHEFPRDLLVAIFVDVFHRELPLGPRSEWSLRGRTPVATKVFGDSQRRAAYDVARRELEAAGAALRVARSPANSVTGPFPSPDGTSLCATFHSSIPAA